MECGRFSRYNLPVWGRWFCLVFKMGFAVCLLLFWCFGLHSISFFCFVFCFFFLIHFYSYIYIYYHCTLAMFVSWIIRGKKWISGLFSSMIDNTRKFAFTVYWFDFGVLYEFICWLSLLSRPIKKDCKYKYLKSGNWLEFISWLDSLYGRIGSPWTALG